MVDASGKLLVHGGCVFQRFLTTGALDTSFGTDGLVDLSSTTGGRWCEVVARSDGSLLVASREEWYAERSEVVLIDPSGAIIDVFPGVSTKTADKAVAFGGEMTDGLLLVIKSTGAGIATKSVLEQWAPDGTPDTSWGNSGSWPVPNRLLLASTTNTGHAVVASSEQIVKPYGYVVHRWAIQRLTP